MTPNELDIDALEALEKAATPGPWKTHLVDDTCICASDGCEVATTCDEDGYNIAYERMEADAAFIVALRNAAPALIAAYREREGLKLARDERTPTISASAKRETIMTIQFDLWDLVAGIALALLLWVGVRELEDWRLRKSLRQRLEQEKKHV